MDTITINPEIRKIGFTNIILIKEEIECPRCGEIFWTQIGCKEEDFCDNRVPLKISCYCGNDIKLIYRSINNNYYGDY